jgi:hypothetical protein
MPKWKPEQRMQLYDVLSDMPIIAKAKDDLPSSDNADTANLSALPTEADWYDDHTDDLAPAVGIGWALAISALIMGALWWAASALLT